MVMVRRGRSALVLLIDAAPRRAARRLRLAIIAVTLAGLLAALLPPVPAGAAGAIWLATQRATQSTMDKSQPSLATAQNHAYLLWLGGASGVNHDAYEV